jgi:flagellar M-ring protein FliF
MGGAEALEGPPSIEPAVPEEEEDPMISLGAVEGQIKASSVRKIGEIIDKHPDEALAILRTWIYEE